ncbi:MAG: zf-HC2 domain-containing protein [Acidobacteria bacterium]|jgi:anti-sigma factor RsiW|nr:zf-HC2 domain-containing protein [Acidobacteriota bacterium]
MRCGEAQKMAGRYVDGELSPGMGEKLRAHAAGCPSCAAELKRLKELGEALALLPEELPPEGLAQAIIAASRFIPVGRNRVAPMQMFGRIAAALLIAASGLYLGARFQTSYASAAAQPVQASRAEATLPETGEFELIPPDSPGALCLALLESGTR